jgi:hypothetical protein
MRFDTCTDNDLFSKFADHIRVVDCNQIAGPSLIPESLVLHREGGLLVPYIPFDWVNARARIVIVGITPGLRNGRTRFSRRSEHCAPDPHIKQH